MVMVASDGEQGPMKRPRGRRVSRRRVRELALRVLFEVDVGRQPLTAAIARAEPEVPERNRPFFRALCEGTWAARKEIDGRLAAFTKDWPVDRLASTDRAVLRMAVYELLHLDTPTRVVLNEAVELATRYGTEASGRFVNGVLGALQRTLSPTTRVPDV